MTDTTIRVDIRTRNRLAEIAAQRNTTIGGLLTQLAQRERTPEDIQTSHQKGLDYIRAHINPDFVYDQAEADRALAEIASAAHRQAAR